MDYPSVNLLDDIVDDFCKGSIFIMSVDLGGLAGDVHLALDVVDGVLLEGLLQGVHQCGKVWKKCQKL
jgi:hypothetical protein